MCVYFFFEPRSVSGKALATLSSYYALYAESLPFWFLSETSFTLGGRAARLPMAATRFPGRRVGLFDVDVVVVVGELVLRRSELARFSVH